MTVLAVDPELTFSQSDIKPVTGEYVCAVCHSDLTVQHIQGDSRVFIMCPEHGNGFNPLDRGFLILTLAFSTPRINRNRILSHLFARLYQPCEPQGPYSKNHAKPSLPRCITPPPIASKLAKTASFSENRCFRTVIALIRIHTPYHPICVSPPSCIQCS